MQLSVHGSFIVLTFDFDAKGTAFLSNHSSRLYRNASEPFVIDSYGFEGRIFSSDPGISKKCLEATEE